MSATQSQWWRLSSYCVTKHTKLIHAISARLLMYSWIRFADMQEQEHWQRQGREHQTVASMMMANRDEGSDEETSINIAVKISNRKPWSWALNPLGVVTSLFPLGDKVYCGQTYHSQPKWFMTINGNGNGMKQHPRMGKEITWIILPPQIRKKD